MNSDPSVIKVGAASQQVDHLFELGARPVAVTPEEISAYARKIRIVKLAVPATGLSLLLLIIAWPYLRDYESGFTLSFEDLSRSSEQLRMENPRYVGIDSERRRFEITAKTALQSQTDAGEVSLDQIKAMVTLQDKSEVVLTAPKGSYLPHRALLTLSGGLKILSGTGYEVNLDHAQYNADTAVASSNDRVEGKAPFGSFAANAFEANIDGQKFKLKGGVHVRIEPHKYKSEQIPGKAMESQQKTEKKG
jgi:lipopolysaccharide export system protein LptC